MNIKLREFDRVWRPGKSMRRVLASCWGVDAAAWTGRRVELYCDPGVVFGGKEVGGTRISRLSHIDKAKKIPLLVTRGKSATFTVEPLPASAVSTPAADSASTDRIASLRAEWKSADPDRQQAIEAEVKALQEPPAAPPAEDTAPSDDGAASWPAVAPVQP